MNHQSDDCVELLHQARNGNSQAVGDLLERFRNRLERIVSFRLDRRLCGRVDPADVVQEAFLECIARMPEYFSQERMPFFLWLRFITVQKLLIVHRQHIGTKARDAAREISLWHGPLPGASSADLAAQLLGRFTTPSQAAVRAETRLKLEQAINSMEPIDREVLALRHFEQLNNHETADLLNINPTTASNRYVRAIKRLKSILDQNPD